MQILHNYPLKTHNTFGFDVKARYYAAPESTGELCELLTHPSYSTLPRLVIGGGSNILFCGDYKGLVINPQLGNITKIEETDETITLCAGAGMPWDNFVNYCVKHNWGGIENLSGIPGTVGASPVQNIGAYGVEVKNTIRKVEALCMESRKPLVFYGDECAFGYRDSIFKHEWKNRIVITRVVFELHKHPVLITHYGTLAKAMETHADPTIQDIRQAILKIRKQKIPDPAETGNAGSFFKNPVISKERANALCAMYRGLTIYPVDEQQVKIPAGWLIEQCGWKGKRTGNVGVHPAQSLVLVNYGGGTGNEVLQLAGAIRQSVREKFDIPLEMEINVVQSYR